MRIYRLILTALLVLCFVFGSRGKLDARDGALTLQLTIPLSLTDVYSPKFLGDFEAAHPGIHVQVNRQDAGVSPAAFGMDQHFEALQKYASSGDVVYVTPGTVSPEATQAGYFLDLSPLVKEDKTLRLEDFYPAVWQSYQWDQGIWALPVSADPYVLLYNPGAFDKAGLSYPNAQWTVDDLINAVRKLTVKDADGKLEPGFDILPSWQGQTFRAMIQTGLVDKSIIPNAPKLDTPEIADLLTKWLQLDREGAIGGENARAPMSLAPAIWLAQQARFPVGEKRAGAMLPGGQAPIRVDAFAISGGTRYPEQAYALAAWLTTRGESANIGLAASPARESLKNAAGSDQVSIKNDVSPEAQAVIDQAVQKAISVADLRFADYLDVAYKRMKNEQMEVTVALQQAENDAVKAQQQAASHKDKVKTALVLPTAIPSSSAADRITLKFAVGNYVPLLPNKAAWDRRIAAFTASDPQVGKIILDVSTNGLDLMAATYDCFYLPYNGVAPDKLARLMPLDPFISADRRFDKADLLGDVLAQVMHDNKIFALPANIAPEVLKYDASAFRQAGVPVPGLQWTLDQFVDALKQLKAFNGDKPAFVPVNTFGNYLLNLIVAYGGLPVDYRTNPPTINFTNPAIVAAIRQVGDLARNGYFRYHPMFTSQVDLVLLPEPSIIKTASLSAYSMGAMLGGARDDKSRLVLYPRGREHATITYGVGTLYIGAATANPEACYRWISAVASDPNLFSSMPARRSQLGDPALAAAQGADTVAIYQQIADLLQDPTTIPVPVIDGGLTTAQLVIGAELFKALDHYLAKDSSVELESVLTDAEASAKAFLDCSGLLPSLDNASAESRKAYWEATRQCATKADPDLALFFAGIKVN